VKQTLVLDEETYSATHACLGRARRGGWDAAESLHRLGLLLSPAVRQQVQVDALVALRQDLERWQPHEMLRRLHKVETSSPADMYTAIVSYLDEYIIALREQR
jgi:hypothetical protein